MRVSVFMFTLVLLGCASGLAVSASAPPAASASVPLESGSPSAAGIAATLPTQLGDVTLGPPQALRAEFLAPLAQELGVDPSSIEGAAVTPAGPSAGPDVAVVRVPGVATDKLIDAYMAFNAKAFEIPATIKPAPERIAGKDVVALRAPGPDGSTPTWSSTLGETPST